jgi:hypothetical protein
MSLHSTIKVHQHTDVTNKLSRKKMEIYVMKKKFLTLALVLMVAVTLFAATPIEVSGELTAGYKFTFAKPAAVAHENAGTANIVSSFTGEHWKVTIGGDLNYGAEQGLANAKADIYLDKALKDEGVDLGDFAVTLHVGTNVSKGAYSVFANKGALGKEAAAMATAQNSGITLGYAKLAKVYFAFFPNKAFPMVVSAQVTPVDGVDVTVGYTNDSAKNDLLATAKVDVKKLADLDFDLAATAQFAYDVDAKASVVGVDAATSIQGISGYVAYRLAAKKHAMAVGGGYSTTIEGFKIGADAKFVVTDFGDFANTWNVVVNASTSYAFGGATYKLAAGYDVDKKAFTLTPTVTIKF